jgi:hypothetical protein
MKERPIIFSAPMVRAILAGTKTQTRRVVKNTGMYAIDAPIHGEETAKRELLALATRCPYGQPGGRLWVRETWAQPDRRSAGFSPWVYAANYQERPSHRWRPSIHMPRCASRILLDVTAVRVERLQDISEADALAEGVTPKWEPGCSGRLMEALGGFSFRPAASAYADLWESINGPGSWDANPWVWMVEFRRV